MVYLASNLSTLYYILNNFNLPNYLLLFQEKNDETFWQKSKKEEKKMKENDKVYN